MKKSGSFYLILTIFLLQASCTKDELGSSQTHMDVIRADEISNQAFTNLNSKSFGPSVVIYEHPEDEDIIVPGATSRLHRSRNGLTVNFKTKNLIPNNAYTLWWVVFGDSPGPPILVTHAAGHIAGASGKGNFSSRLNIGEIFNTPLTAEVHLALRSHGPAQPGMIPEQIHTIDGGCVTGFPSGPSLHPDSDEAGYCANVQVAMHPGN